MAAAGMAIPTFAKVVDKATVTLPLVGTVNNIVTQIGSNGVVGIKSGYTSQAGACMVLAGYRTIGGRSVLVLALALGQPRTGSGQDQARPSGVAAPPVSPRPNSAWSSSTRSATPARWWRNCSTPPRPR